jgi:hypothetical protein
MRKKASDAPQTAVRRATVIATMKTRSIIILEGFEALSHPGSKAEKKRSVPVRLPTALHPIDRYPRRLRSAPPSRMKAEKKRSVAVRFPYRFAPLLVRNPRKFAPVLRRSLAGIIRLD